MQTGQCNKLFNSGFPTKEAPLPPPPNIYHQWQQHLTRIRYITNSSVTLVSVIFSLFPLSKDRNLSLGDGLVNSEKMEAKEEKNKVSLIVILDLLCCL